MNMQSSLTRDGSKNLVLTCSIPDLGYALLAGASLLANFGTV